MASAMHAATVSSASVRRARPLAVAVAALAIATVVPHAQADAGSYQPVLDQLLDAMQQAVAYDAGLPFATADSDAMLLTGLQNTNYELLSAGLSRVTELF